MWEVFKINLAINERMQYIINGILFIVICIVFPIIKWLNKYLFSEYGEYSISSMFWKNDYIVRWWRDPDNKHTINFNVVRVNSKNEANKIVYKNKFHDCSFVPKYKIRKWFKYEYIKKTKGVEKHE